MAYFQNWAVEKLRRLSDDPSPEVKDKPKMTAEELIRAAGI